MVGLFVIGSVLVIGLVVFTFFKMKWKKEDKAVFRARADRIEKDRIETVARAETGGGH